MSDDDVRTTATVERGVTHTVTERLEMRRRLMDDGTMWRVGLRTYGLCVAIFGGTLIVGVVLVMLLASPKP